MSKKPFYLRMRKMLIKNMFKKTSKSALPVKMCAPRKIREIRREFHVPERKNLRTRKFVGSHLSERSVRRCRTDFPRAQRKP